MNAAHIATTLAGRRAQRLSDGSYLTRCPVPSHGKGRGDQSPSLRIADGETRLLVRCFCGCDPRDVLEALRQRGLEDGPAPTPIRRPQPKPKPAPSSAAEYKRRQAEKARYLWSRRQPIANSIAEKYLREARGIACALPPTLAFLPPSRPDHHPAMIAAFGIPGEPEPGMLGVPRAVDAVHLTALAPDGSGKAPVEKPKIVVGSPAGLPIVLAPPNDLLGLAITEGIEDALTAHLATGLSAWAAGSAGFMPALASSVPNYIEAATIFAHSDKAGQHGARELAATLRQRGIEVKIEALPS
jgi:putative DNA primase/helicase